MYFKFFSLTLSIAVFSYNESEVAITKVERVTEAWGKS